MFNEVDFNKEESKDTRIVSDEELTNKVRVTEFIKFTREEIARIRAGNSTLAKPMHFPDTAPVIVILNHFEENPTSKGLFNFLAIAKQDLGQRVFDRLLEESTDLFLSRKKTEEEVLTESFPDQIKRVFYNVARIGVGSLSQKQVEDIERESVNFANLIEKRQVERLTMLQKAISEGFRMFEEKLNEKPKKAPRKRAPKKDEPIV